ncbi:MAG: Do family serine endopeptidase [Legionellales bacterium]|jgi:Do/DeqQ family serine protease
MSLFVLNAYAALPTDTMAPVLEKAMPSVVNIATTRVTAEPTQNNVVPSEAKRSTNLASGVIVDSDKGYILTNFHVVQGAEEVMITLSDGRNFPAKFIGGDPESDVAVVQIQAEKLNSIALGDSDTLHVGDFVLAIGNPFGLSQSVSSGIISALGRTDLGLEGYEDFIQTDAAINMGNSGGALINIRGELIGINTAILSNAGGSVGIGFAIPINMARNIMQQLIQFGEVRRGLLGVVAQSLTPDLAAAFDTSKTHGAIISQIVAESPAADSGLKIGDVVLTINDKPVNSASELRNQIGLVAIDSEITLGIERLGKAQTIKIKMTDPRTHTTALSRINPHFAGMEVAPLHETIATHGEVEGLELLQVNYGSNAWRAGLRTGDIITQVNHQDIASIKDLESAAKKQKDLLLLRVLRGPNASFMIIR